MRIEFSFGWGGGRFLTHTKQFSIDVHLQQNDITYLTILKEEHPAEYQN